MVRDTSLLAFIELSPLLGERQQLVLSTLSRLGKATDMEIAASLGALDPNMVRPRRKELYDLGLIKAVGKRECTITHRTVYEWAVVKHGKNTGEN